ncbi:mannose-1-phosphate guanylyltransferase / mannose-6-phosphate isomerase [Selenomonas ruminantium]|uniref:mannose-1-phosphate guanylyltransferase n=1 Tax=Selenomonas ruminantium TaxID=971 RepID=A0A1M6TF21_SELRU|nr:mannose-1-phosphate guanylyltransferase/mannose-6-phosphate isomerase [Selenomonas ruminantium]SHK55436.1 mannose-1-phosphate guanylyltransferase / mannose-6-phosphate isomerase [Selenomonas ruminantium]
MKVIILAGGGGSRLFPLSRQSYPKQFLKLEDDSSLLSHTVLRFMSFVSAEDIIIITNQKYLYHVQNELSECKAEAVHILLEPVSRNTAPAIALGAAFCRTKLNCDENEVLLVAAADHVIRPINKFQSCVRNAENMAMAGKLVTFGIPAERPETGYGYIETVKAFNNILEVVSFKEKPDFATAQKYMSSGNYFWNSGMFAFSLPTIYHEMMSYQPQIAQQMEKGYDDMLYDFASLPDISIDYAVFEQSKNVCMIQLSCYWNDIGSWDAMYDILPKDDNGNAVKGDVLALDCKDSLIMGRDRLIVGIGFDDLLLVETDDVIVVAKKGESQKVKNVVDKLKGMHRKEADEHTTIFHAWGTSSIIGQGPGYRMKKVRIMPGKSLSLQMHYHRTEHWVILCGTAEVVRGEEHMFIHEEESVFIPQTVKHRLSNPGKIPLELIEIQNGTYISEEDIVRFADR